MRNFRQAFLLILVVLGIHTGVANGARWSEISTGLPLGAAAEGDARIWDDFVNIAKITYGFGVLDSRSCRR